MIFKDMLIIAITVVVLMVVGFAAVINFFVEVK